MLPGRLPAFQVWGHWVYLLPRQNRWVRRRRCSLVFHGTRVAARPHTRRAITLIGAARARGLIGPMLAQAVRRGNFRATANEGQAPQMPLSRQLSLVVSSLA